MGDVHQIRQQVTPRAKQPTTEPNERAEKARYAKAAKVAARWEQLYGLDPEMMPTNRQLRLAAQILISESAIADQPFSDESCEVTRTILRTRAAIRQESRP